MGDRNPSRRPEVAAKISAAHIASGRFAGQRHPNYKSGQWVRKDGRVMVRVGPDHYRLRYHVIWEQAHPDDPIKPGEVIHHINGVKDDDRLENLAKLTNSVHIKGHDLGHHPGALRGAEPYEVHRARDIA